MIALPDICILAGGRGTRLGALSRNLPKPMIPVAGKPFLEHQLELLRENGARRIVICTGYRGAMIRDTIRDGTRLGLEVEYSDDGPSLLGTAGAVRAALPLLSETFMVLYGDTYLRVDYRAVVRAHQRAALPALMTVLRNRDRWDRSNALYADGRVLAYDKRTPPAGAEWIDYGLSVFVRPALSGTDEQDLADVVSALARAGRLAGFEAFERFFEIGTPTGLTEAEAFLRSISAPARPHDST